KWPLNRGIFKNKRLNQDFLGAWTSVPVEIRSGVRKWEIGDQIRPGFAGESSEIGEVSGPCFFQHGKMAV
ncbi:hypothetical protein, partial [Methanoregula sp.]|uniref:hypothetical protein n=1 Tax=Methanoregula sp. TaxID=2052170 RepID=UPI003C6AC34F